MFLQYGNYTHPAGEVSLTPIQRTLLFNSGQICYGFTERWRIKGFLQAANQAGITNAIAGLIAAYSYQGQDLRFFDDNGNPTHGTLSSQTFGGVRVVGGPSFPTGDGAEYSTYRSYEIEVEFEVRNPQVGLLSWTESVSYSGGGPLFVFLEPINGLPQKQQAKQATTFRAVQRGSAVGQFDCPTPPPPIWPGDLERAPEPVRTDPKRHGKDFSEYQIDWTYYFASVTPLSGNPTLWPS